MVIELKHLTFKQRQAYHIRFHHCWRVIRTTPRPTRLLSLSRAWRDEI